MCMWKGVCWLMVGLRRYWGYRQICVRFFVTNVGCCEMSAASEAWKI